MGLKTRVPARIWNAYHPRTCVAIEPSPRLKLKLRLRIPPATPAPQKAAFISLKAEEDDPKDPTHCKVKLFRSHYDSPQRQRKGHWQNEIAYEQPCLQPTCPNCQRWHAHLLQQPQVLEIGVEGRKPEQEPISPDIDPRILDGTWRLHQTQPHSIGALITPSTPWTAYKTPVLTPVVKDIPRHPPPARTVPPGRKYHILLPTPLTTLATTTPSVRSLWRTSPRKQYTARLVFGSHEGRGKYTMLMKKREKREKRREYDRARRARLRGVMDGCGLVETGICRSRQRVRLVFGSENGIAAFGRAVAQRR